MRVPEGGVTAVESVFFQLSYLDNFFLHASCTVDGTNKLLLFY